MACSLDLSGVWSLKSSEWKEETIPANLPGDNYSALLAAGKIPDPHYGRNELAVQEFRRHDWEYSRDFDVPAELLGYEHVYLNAEMVDTFATVLINGKKVLSCENMFTRYRTDVKAALRPGSNRIEIRFKSAENEAKKAAAEQPFPVPMNGCSKVPNLNLIRKVHCHGGWDWGLTLMVTGVYMPLTLTGVNTARIDYLYADQKHEKNRVTVTAVAELFAEKGYEIVGIDEEAPSASTGKPARSMQRSGPARTGSRRSSWWKIRACGGPTGSGSRRFIRSRSKLPARRSSRRSGCARSRW